jgi:uncharacterized protein
MRKFLTILALTCVLAAPAIASAEPTAKAMALTRRMVVAMHVEENMAPMLRTMLRQQVDLTVAQRNNLSDQQKTQLSSALSEAMDEIFAGGFMSEMMEKLIPAYAEVYSEDELQALVDFYESPMGQRVLRKMPLLGPAAAKVIADVTPKMQADMIEKLTKKLEGLDSLSK